MICGRIDEQIVGRIVARLATRTDLENWDEKTPLPELPLAIFCLSELGNLNRLESAGGKLLNVVIEVTRRAENNLNEFLKDDLLSACRELGERWPGRDILNNKLKSTVFLRAAKEAKERVVGEGLWPHLIAHVSANRAAVLVLARTMSGFAYGAYYRGGALAALADKWPDEKTRKLLADRALQDFNSYVRCLALQVLVDNWTDEKTRKLLADCALQDDKAVVRSFTLKALADKWTDDKTRKLIEDRALQDDDPDLRSEILQTLANKWPDENTRKLIADRALQDDYPGVRRAALNALVDEWPDENTRKLIEDRALQDDDSIVRRDALEALAKKWFDDGTRKLIAERALQDDNGVVRGAAAALIGGLHSRFGRLVFCRHYNKGKASRPYLDPSGPIPRSHIQRAAQKANVPNNKINQTVRSLSEFLGWDITRGSGAS